MRQIRSNLSTAIATDSARRKTIHFLSPSPAS